MTQLLNINVATGKSWVCWTCRNFFSSLILEKLWKTANLTLKTQPFCSDMRSEWNYEFKYPKYCYLMPKWTLIMNLLFVSCIVAPEVSLLNVLATSLSSVWVFHCFVLTDYLCTRCSLCMRCNAGCSWLGGSDLSSHSVTIRPDPGDR